MLDLRRRCEPLTLWAAVFAFLAVFGLLAFGAAAFDRSPRVSAWVAPPESSSTAPFMIAVSPASDRPLRRLSAPPGSRMTLWLEGEASSWQVNIRGGADAELAIKPRPGGFVEVGFAVAEGMEAAEAIDRRSGRRFEAPVPQIVNAPPRIAFGDNLRISARGVFRYAVRVEDDDSGLRLRMTTTPQDDDGTSAPIETEIAAPPALHSWAPAASDGVFFHDFELSPLSGRRIGFRVTAIDGAGATAVSPLVTMQPPFRDFSSPPARLLTAMRRRLEADFAAEAEAAARLSSSLRRRRGCSMDEAGTYLTLLALEKDMRADADAATAARVAAGLHRLAAHVEDGDGAAARNGEGRLGENLSRAFSDPNVDRDARARMIEAYRRAAVALLSAYLDGRRLGYASAPSGAAKLASGASSVSLGETMSSLDHLDRLNRLGYYRAASGLLAAIRGFFSTVVFSEAAAGEGRTEAFLRRLAAMESFFGCAAAAGIENPVYLQALAAIPEAASERAAEIDHGNPQANAQENGLDIARLQAGLAAMATLLREGLPAEAAAMAAHLRQISDATHRTPPTDESETPAAEPPPPDEDDRIAEATDAAAAEPPPPHEDDRIAEATDAAAAEPPSPHEDDRIAEATDDPAAEPPPPVAAGTATAVLAAKDDVAYPSWLPSGDELDAMAALLDRLRALLNRARRDDGAADIDIDHMSRLLDF